VRLLLQDERGCCYCGGTLVQSIASLRESSLLPLKSSILIIQFFRLNAGYNTRLFRSHLALFPTKTEECKGGLKMDCADFPNSFHAILYIVLSLALNNGISFRSFNIFIAYFLSLRKQNSLNTLPPGVCSPFQLLNPFTDFCQVD
jgi:hypothetical protein